MPWRLSKIIRKQEEQNIYMKLNIIWLECFFT